MGKSFVQAISNLPVDILVQMNAKLVPFLAKPLQPDDTYSYRLVENKRVLFVFNTSSDILKEAQRVGVRTVLVIKTGKSCHQDIQGGDVLMLKDNHNVFETRLIPFLSEGFGVRLANYPQDLTPLGMRIIGFMVIIDSLPRDVSLIQQILDHLLVCTTANL